MVFSLRDFKSSLYGREQAQQNYKIVKKDDKK